MGKRPRGAEPHWVPSTAAQVGILADVITAYVEHYANDTLRRGGRGIFYDLRPAGREPEARLRAIRELGRLLGRRYRGYALEVLRAEMARDEHRTSYRKPDSTYPLTRPVLDADGRPLKTASGKIKKERNFGPMEFHEGAVQEVLLRARRAGIIPEEWVADTRAPDSMGNSYEESAESDAQTIGRIVRDAAGAFDLDPQRFQPVHVEILCEAEDLIRRLARIANPYGVKVYSGAGYGGLKGKRSFAERAQARGKPTVVLNVSDRDGDGDDIYIAAAEDSVAWAADGGAVFPLDWYEEPRDLALLRKRLAGEPVRGSIFFVRFALTEAQARELGLLDADGKAEVDGVPVATMDAWITEAIRALQTSKGRKRHRVALRLERELLPGLVREQLAGWLEDGEPGEEGELE